MVRQIANQSRPGTLSVAKVLLPDMDGSMNRIKYYKKKKKNASDAN